MGAHALPSAEAQLVFLGKLQRIFTESDFTATYKFALLMALADLAVELGADDGEELALSIRQIAERFIQLYWPQALPYGTGRPNTSPASWFRTMAFKPPWYRPSSLFGPGMGQSRPSWRERCLSTPHCWVLSRRLSPRSR